MKKVEFGFANDVDPKGSWQGIGLREGLLITDGEYIGAISCCNDTYIVAKIEECQNHPEYVGKYIARKALYDMYPDGSGILFLNQKEDYITQKIEALINRSAQSQDISSIEDIIRLSEGFGKASRLFQLAETEGEKVFTCSITAPAFEEKNELLKSCHGSLSQMAKELKELESQRK